MKITGNTINPQIAALEIRGTNRTENMRMYRNTVAAFPYHFAAMEFRHDLSETKPMETRTISFIA